jgi:putative ABC transport system permease protein
MGLLNRIWSSLRPSSMDRDLRQEMETHMAELEDDERRQGANPAQAHDSVRQRFGNPTVYREQARERNLLAWIETFVQDIRYAVRQFASVPGFTVTAVVMLALGIGANAAIFTLLNSIVLRSLPLPNADRLAIVLERNANGGNSPPSWLDQRDLREQTHSFESMAAFSYDSGFLLQSGDETKRVIGGYVTPDYFATLGVAPIAGRVFDASEATAGRDNVALIREDYWHEALNSDPEILQKTIQLNGRKCNIIGILPRAFRFPWDEAVVWAPLVPPLDIQKERGYHGFPMVARLRPGVTFAQASADEDAIMHRLAKQYPDADTDRGGLMYPMKDWKLFGTSERLLVLQYAALAIFLMTCANVSSLLMARYSSRKREFAVRAALGASRGRRIRQHLTESVALAAMGCACGAVVAYFGVQFLLALYGDSLPRAAEVALDARLVWFTIATTLAGAFAFGLTAALHEDAKELESALRDGGRVGSGRKGAFARKAMVVVQVVCAVTLLAGAGELLESFRKLIHVDAGLNADHLLTMRIALPDSQYATGAQVSAFFQSAIERIRAIPGVESAATTNMLPVQNMGFNGDVEVIGLPPHASSFFAEFRWVSGDYFRTMGVPLVRGRAFSPEEIAGKQKAMVISEKMARMLWAERDPIGWKVKFDDGELYTVIGIARDVRQSGLAQASRAELYVPLATQSASMTGQSLAVRSPLSMDQLAPLIRRELQNADPQAAVYRVKTMQEVLADSVAFQRIMVTLLGMFAGLALLLAAFGLHGVMSYLVTERRHEFAIRLAIGARPAEVLRMVFRQSFTMVGIGIALGLGAAFAVSKTLPSLLNGVSELDAATLAVAVVVLASVAAAAVGVPALRALRIDPIVALRQE